jgi:hypothetical protein
MIVCRRQHAEFVRQEKELATGRAEKFTWEKTSIYQSNLTDSYAAISCPSFRPSKGEGNPI